jgi:hypothetical protein
MYGIEYEDDILLLLRMIKFLHMQSPDAAHIFCQSHPVVDMEELLMVIDEVMWDIFDDVNFFFDEEYEATVVQCSHPIIDRLYEQGRASDPKHGSRQSVWSKKLHDITEYFVLGQQTPFTNSHSISPEIMSFWNFACRRITTSRSILQIRWWICFVTANAASGE